MQWTKVPSGIFMYIYDTERIITYYCGIVCVNVDFNLLKRRRIFVFFFLFLLLQCTLCTLS